MSNFIPYNFKENNFLLHSSRLIFWEEESAIILSDMHFGKISHFRKHGIALPTNVVKEDIQRLFEAIQFFKPKKIIIVGDLFHSVSNNEHALFSRWRNDLQDVEFILVKGNHDIIGDAWYENANITVVKDFLKLHDFIFVHQKEDYKTELEPNEYLVCGHVHPAVVLKGLGKQSLKFNCFYWSKKFMLLPAFGKFTGNFLVEPTKSDIVFAIVNDAVMKL
jgi:uncharacterized protein